MTGARHDESDGHRRRRLHRLDARRSVARRGLARRRGRRPLERLARATLRSRARSPTGSSRSTASTCRRPRVVDLIGPPPPRRGLPPRGAGRRAGVGRAARVRRDRQHPRHAQRLRGRGRGRRRARSCSPRRAARSTATPDELPDPRGPAPTARVALRRRQEGRRRLPLLLPEGARPRVHRAGPGQRVRPAPGPARRSRSRVDLRGQAARRASGR